MDTMQAYRESISNAIQQDTEDSLIVQNLPLVLFLARKFVIQFKGINLDDLIGSGNLALVKAAKEYNPSLGYKFSTYASAAIYREFLKVIDRTGIGVHIPKKTLDHIATFQKFYREKGRIPDLQESADILERRVRLTYERYLQILNAMRLCHAHVGMIHESMLTRRREHDSEDSEQ